MMALQLSEDRISFTERRNQIIDGLHALPGHIKTVLESDASYQQLARGVLANQRSLLLMGRGYQYVHPSIRGVACADEFPQVLDLPRGRAQDQGNQLHALGG